MGEVFLIERPADKCIVFFILLHRTAFPEAAKRSKARTPEFVGFIHARVHILHSGNYRRLISRSRLVAVGVDLHVDLHVDLNVDLNVFKC